METTRSPKFLGNPNSHPPCSPTPAGPQWQAICHLSAAPTYLNDKDPRINKSVEAQSHGCCDRCLRFTTAVTRGHARLASGCWPALPGWIDYQPGCSERFQLLHVLLSQALLGAIKIYFMNPHLPPEYRQLQLALSRIGFFRRGTLLTRMMTCGKPVCACKASPPRLHGPYYQWTRKVDGKTVTVNLSADQACPFGEHA